MEKKTRSPAQKRSIKTKNKLLKSGLELFSEKGYFNTNSKDIAKHADTAIGSFYSYFKDKKSLFIEIIKDQFNNIKHPISIGNLAGIYDEKNKEKLIEFIVKVLFSKHKIPKGIHREVSIMRKMDPEINEFMEKQESIVINHIFNILENFKDKIKVSDLHSASIILFFSIEAVIHKIEYSETPVDKDKLIEELITMISNYLF